MKEHNLYTNTFYDVLERMAFASAEIIVPILKEFFAPNSVVDIGCGTGAWLRSFQHHGVYDVMGIDHFCGLQLPMKISSEHVLDMDLRYIRPLDRRFDLALCLEVAEHLGPENADGLVRFLTSVSPIVAFSAAIPQQGGVNHQNEQWPRYWTNLFSKFDYVALDFLRPLIWDFESVAVWYRQNLLIFIEREKFKNIADYIESQRSFGATDLVHPDLWKTKCLNTHKSVSSKLAKRLYSGIKSRIQELNARYHFQKWITTLPDDTINLSANTNHLSSDGRQFHCIYFSCSKHYQMLSTSIASLLRLNLPNIASIRVYVDAKDPLTQSEIDKLSSISTNIRIINCKKVTGFGISSLYTQMEVIRSLIPLIQPIDVLVKIDSDVLFISRTIFLHARSKNFDLLGDRCLDFKGNEYTQGGCYFLSTSFICALSKSHIGEALKETVRITCSTPMTVPEDAFVYRLVSLAGMKVEFVNYYLPVFKIRSLSREDLQISSLIHFERRIFGESRSKMSEIFDEVVELDR